MNKREKLASVILVLTLVAGTVVDILGKRGDRVGLQDQAGVGSESAAATCGPDSAAPGPGGAGAAGDEGPAAESAGRAGEDRAEAVGSYRKIDLNAACLEELVLLPGIGPKKAEALLEWRGRNGRFKSIEDVLEVKGIGPGTLERLRPYATVGE